jgi:hypothetical protein
MYNDRYGVRNVSPPRALNASRVNQQEVESAMQVLVNKARKY